MISLLSDLYPTSLDKWTERKMPPGYTALHFDHFHVLNLAVKMDICPILPVVMYDICCTHPLEAIVSGIGAKIESSEYRTRCCLGCSRLQLAQRHALGYLTNRDLEGEAYRQSGPTCNAARARWLALDLENDHIDPLAHGTLASWEAFGLSSPCLEAAKQMCQDAREQVWDDLPGIFGFGTWDELLA
jgi:hypothetical protein